MCRKFFLCFLLLQVLAGHAQQLFSAQVNITANDTVAKRNAVIYLPKEYAASKKYPLVIYLHGISQAGTDISKLYATGLPKVLKDGYQPKLEFVMVAPQSATYSIDPAWLEGMLNDIKKRWPIDTNRIYLTGIDAGGWAALGSQVNISAALAKKITAIVSISGAMQNVSTKNIAWWKGSQTPLWAIAGEQDKAYAKQNKAVVDAVNNEAPGVAGLTLLPNTGHGGWNDVYRGKVTVAGKTIWQWLAQFDRAKTFSKPHMPVASLKTASAMATPTPVINSGVTHIEAEDYIDMSGVRTQSTTDVGGGRNVGWIDKDDWMDYGFTVQTAGVYTVKLRLAASTTGAKFQLQNGSGSVLVSVDVPKTGGWQHWQDLSATVTLPAGAQTLRFISTAVPIWNINYFEVSGAAAASTTLISILTTGTKIEAENFSDRSGILKQGTLDFTGGFQNLFDVDYGDWVSYSINAPASGQYTLCLRMACNASDARFQIKNGSGSVLTTVDVPKTNGWQTWRDVTAVINLNAGMQTLKLQAVSTSGWNLNYFEVVKTPLNAFASYTLRVNSGTSIYLPNGLNLAHLKPGDTLTILGGTYNVIELGNFKGTAANPLIIRNRNGQVACKILRLSNTPEYFRLLGNGDASVIYGFKINSAYTTGSCLTAFGKGFEIAYVEAMQSKSGFFIKKNPSATDPQSQFPNYLMDNISIHHNYIHDITGEGMYVGHTGADGGQGGNMLLPVRMRNVEIAYNKVDHTGWDGIQLANATTGNKIHHNTVTNFGTTNTYGQQAGILLGGNSEADIYDNTIETGTGNGIQNFGFGLNKIYNNTIENVGRNETTRGYEAVYCNDIIIKSETRPKQQIQAYNNIIKYPMPWGAIRVSGYNKNSLPATMQYNEVLLPNAPSGWEKLYFPTYVPNSVISDNTLINN